MLGAALRLTMQTLNWPRRLLAASGLLINFRGMIWRGYIMLKSVHFCLRPPSKRSRSLRKPSVGVSFVQVPMLWAGSPLSPDDLSISFGR